MSSHPLQSNEILIDVSLLNSQTLQTDKWDILQCEDNGPSGSTLGFPGLILQVLTSTNCFRSPVFILRMNPIASSWPKDPGYKRQVWFMVLKTEFLYFFPLFQLSGSDGITPSSKRQNVVACVTPGRDRQCRMGFTRDRGWDGKPCTVLATFWFKSQSWWLFGLAGLTMHFKDLAINKKYSEAPFGIKDNY